MVRNYYICVKNIGEIINTKTFKEQLREIVFNELSNIFNFKNECMDGIVI